MNVITMDPITVPGNKGKSNYRHMKVITMDPINVPGNKGKSKTLMISHGSGFSVFDH